MKERQRGEKKKERKREMKTEMREDKEWEGKGYESRTQAERRRKLGGRGLRKERKEEKRE